MTRARIPGQDARDAELWARIQNNDARALGVLVDAYADELHRVAFYTVRSSDIADDVVQDVFVRLWERRATLTIAGSVIAYLYRMTHNVALNAIRHEQATERAHAKAQRESLIHTPAADNSGAWIVVNDEFQAALNRALELLPQQVRTVFLMARMQGMTYAEIASTLDIAEVTVRSHVSRATRRLVEVMRATHGGHSR